MQISWLVVADNWQIFFASFLVTKCSYEGLEREIVTSKTIDRLLSQLPTLNIQRVHLHNFIYLI